MKRSFTSAVFLFLAVMASVFGWLQAAGAVGVCTPPKECVSEYIAEDSCTPGTVTGDLCDELEVCCTPLSPDPEPSPTPEEDTGSSGLVPCGYQEVSSEDVGDSASSAKAARKAAEDCDFWDLLQLAKNIIDFLLYVIAVPLAAIMFAYAGWLYLSAGGNESKVKEAHHIFGMIAMGLALALAAWLIINAIVTGLEVVPKFNPLTGGKFGK